MKKLIPPLAVLTCLAASATRTPAAVLTVSPTGQSLAEAADRAQPGDIIRVASGVYKLAHP
jgi:hypothetical protein